MGRGAAFVRDEGRCQFVHGLARENEAAWVHFGIARHAVQKRRRFEGGFVWLLVEWQVAVFWTGFQHLNQPGAAAWRRLVRHPAAAKTPREMVGKFPHLPLRHA